ncbi:MAG: hypothetical protein E7231_01805 [Cellulosilyticum sp.]|nr:hypothetical protein [Cellulosilyticum sp.]
MAEVVNILIIMAGIMEVIFYVILLARFIYWKWVKQYRYLNIGHVSGKIGILLFLFVMSTNAVCFIGGSSSNLAMPILMGSLCYASISQLICFEGDEELIINGEHLKKSKTFITNKEEQNKTNVIKLECEKKKINVLVSHKGKVILYNYLSEK